MTALLKSSIALVVALGMLASSAYAAADETTLTVRKITDKQVKFDYTALPKRTYINLLWENSTGGFEATDQVTPRRKGSGAAIIKFSPHLPSGTFKLQARSIDDMYWVAESAEFTIGDTAAAEINCTLVAQPTRVKRGGTVDLTWSSRAASYARWKQDQSANMLGLPAKKLLGDGTESIEIPSNMKSQTLAPILELYRDDGTRGRCTTKFTIK